MNIPYYKPDPTLVDYIRAVIRIRRYREQAKALAKKLQQEARHARS